MTYFTSNEGNVKQITSRIEEGLHAQIEDMARKEGRSVSQVIAILLQSAVNERKRKKKKQKDGLQPG